MLHPPVTAPGAGTELTRGAPQDASPCASATGGGRGQRTPPPHTLLGSRPRPLPVAAQQPGAGSLGSGSPALARTRWLPFLSGDQHQLRPLARSPGPVTVSASGNIAGQQDWRLGWLACPKASRPHCPTQNSPERQHGGRSRRHSDFSGRPLGDPSPGSWPSPASIPCKRFELTSI